jgi:hypothetical protein
MLKIRAFCLLSTYTVYVRPFSSAGASSSTPEMLKSENWDLSIGFKRDYAHAGAHLVRYRDGAVHAYKLGPSFS